MSEPSLREVAAAMARVAASHEDPAARAQAEAWLTATRADLEQNPLTGFEPHAAQRDFILARTPIVAAFAGNRFGKSTALAVCALREALPANVLPPILQGSKRFEGPTQGWVLVPTEDKIDDSFRPAFVKWCPPSELQGGSWGKAFKGDTNLLRFKCGSTIQFKTYKQDPSTLGGAGLHYVGYDEPPPRKHREECMWRLGDHGGFEMFAMTPLDTNTGYVRREIYKKRESPDITVVQGSVHENPTLDKATIARAIGSTSDIYRAAREFGTFVNVGGLIYPEFEKCVAPAPWPADVVRTWEHVVSIDPGIRNCGIIFEGFDNEDVCRIFDELLLQDATPKQYAEAIRQVLARWGIPLNRVSFVSDPAAKQRGQSNAQTVMSALALEGIYCNPGQNDVEAGIGQGRTRMEHGRLFVSPECRGLRDEADDYAAKEPEEGQDDSHLVPVKGNDHRLDAARYGWMEHFWDPSVEEEAPQRNLGYFDLSKGLPANQLRTPREAAHPMGFMT